MHQFVSAIGEYKIKRISETFNHKTVRKVINTMFNVIIWGSYSSSEIDEFTVIFSSEADCNQTTRH